MGEKLRCPGGHQEIRPGGFRRHGAGGSGTTKPVVYNTLEEIEKFWDVLRKISAGFA